ncbi:hypothetical protein HK44_021640 [Pseudomonas fluorescens HK44]|uniref:Uncharacterized protein n=1 Tax=Pseudomonas fluorescens HK44 TaxID=1042209 RepID=A0A010RVT1_PSEFL|nr:hypothetical protein HK44_021640 [Pseudomonas fluorescens HK44]
MHVALALLAVLQGEVMETLIERFIMAAIEAVAFVGNFVLDERKNIGSAPEWTGLEPLHKGDVDGDVTAAVGPRLSDRCTELALASTEFISNSMRALPMEPAWLQMM